MILQRLFRIVMLKPFHGRLKYFQEQCADLRDKSILTNIEQLFMETGIILHRGRSVFALLPEILKLLLQHSDIVIRRPVHGKFRHSLLEHDSEII